MEAKLWGAITIMEFAWDRNWHDIIFKTNFANFANKIKCGCDCNHPLFHLIKRVRCLLNRD